MRFVAVLLLAITGTQSCQNGGGVAPLTPLNAKPLSAVCGKPFTLQLVTGGTPPYHITIKNVSDPSGMMQYISYALPGGGSTPVKEGVTTTTTGFLVGTIPCALLADPQHPPMLRPSVDMLLAGKRLTIRRPDVQFER